MTIILPIIAVLSVTSEWSQRSGLATFTLVPHRGRVVLAKAVAAVLVTVPATAVAFAVGAVGNVIGTALADVPTVWDQSLVDVGYFAAGQTLLLLVGFVLGALIRNSSGAIVAYMLYGFVVPGLLAFLAFNQDWFADARPWLDAKYNQDALLRGQTRRRRLVAPGGHERGVAGRPDGGRGRQRAPFGGEVTGHHRVEDGASPGRHRSVEPHRRAVASSSRPATAGLRCCN